MWPLLLLALAPTVTLIGSKLQSGDWLTWVKAIPSWLYMTFFCIIALWFITGVVLRRIRRLRERNLPSLPSGFLIPPWGYTRVGTLPYKGVVWRYQIPAPPPSERLTIAEARSARVELDIPPRCPKCDTELEEIETFFGRFRWSCLRCGFRRKNNLSFYHEAMRAEKLAQSEWEKGSREQNQ